MLPTDRLVTAIEFRVRPSEVSSRGIIHESCYIQWFEEARLRYGQTQGIDFVAADPNGYVMHIAEFEAQYFSQIQVEDLIIVHCWIEALEDQSVIFGYEARNNAGGKLCLAGRTRHVYADREGQHGTIPAVWKGKLQMPYDNQIDTSGQ
jgi:YbgC/YbaW family acyl-CoA thioester hydrolase